MIMAAFHALEYLVTAWYHPDTVTQEGAAGPAPRRPLAPHPRHDPAAFLIDHSTQYQAALVAGWVEFWVELWLAPSMKALSAFSAAGLALALAGQAVRTAAMVTAGRNFTHRIASRRAPTHRLVTWGPYACVRRCLLALFRDHSWAVLPIGEGLYCALPSTLSHSQPCMHTLPSVLRHPSYTGWFYWSAATQLLLANPICTLAYTLAAWSFFRHRIP